MRSAPIAAMRGARVSAVSSGAIGISFCKQNVSGIESGIDAHGGDAGHAFAAGDGPLNRRRAAILGQQRRVQVEVAQRRQIDHPLRNDATVADDDDCVGRDARQVAREILRCS